LHLFIQGSLHYGELISFIQCHYFILFFKIIPNASYKTHSGIVSITFVNSVTTQFLMHSCGRVIAWIGSVLEGTTNLQRLFQEFSFLFVVSGPLLSACGSKYRSFMYETHTCLCGVSHEYGFIYANEY